MLKIGDRVVATQDHGYSFREGDTGIIIDVDDGDYPFPYFVRFDVFSPGFNDDGQWWARADQVKLIEADKSSAGDLTAQMQAGTNNLSTDYTNAGDAVAMPGTGEHGILSELPDFYREVGTAVEVDSPAPSEFTMVIFHKKDVPVGTAVYVKTPVVVRS